MAKEAPQNPADLAKQASKLGELRVRILFLIGALIVYRCGTYIPVPGVDPVALADFFDQQSGGLLATFQPVLRWRVVTLRDFRAGHRAVHFVIDHHADGEPHRAEPRALRKEGESGRRQIVKYTRYGTVALASFQSIAAASWLQGQPGLVVNPGPAFLITACITLVTGTVFLMWLGEQITERGIGNGISMIILAGIVAGLPARSRVRRAGSQRRNVASYGNPDAHRRYRGDHLRRLHGACTAPHHGELRTASAGPEDDAGAEHALAVQDQHVGCNSADFCLEHPDVPGDDRTVFRSGGRSNCSTARVADHRRQSRPGQPVYVLMYAAMIIFFCFFYTALQYNSKETADQLKKGGAFLPGIRPGAHTAEYIDRVLTRLTFWGALYIAAYVCCLSWSACSTRACRSALAARRC